MKVLMVAPRFSAKSGGGGYVITKNLVELLSKGHDVQLWTSDYETTQDDLVKRDYKVVYLHTLFTLFNFHITPKLIQLASNVLDEAAWGMFTDPKYQIDIIHLQGCRTFQNIVVSHYARKYKIAYIVDAHGFPIQGSFFHKLMLRLFDWLFANRIVRGAEYCIAETETGKKEYMRAGVKENKIEIIPCPYDLSIFNDLPKKGEFKRKWGIPHQNWIVGFLGGIDHIKGVDLLCKAFYKLGYEYMTLVIAGSDMGGKKEVDDTINKLGIKGVVFTGYISGRDKLEFLADCNVCVFPSRAEQGLPFAGLESIMCGTPIVVTDGTGSAEDVKKMDKGFVCKVDDLAQEIDKVLFDENTDIGKRVKNMQGYIRKNLSNESQIKKYEDLYGRILTKHNELIFNKHLYYLE